MKRSVKGMAVIIAGMTFSALGCASSGTGLWNPVTHLSPKKYSDDTRLKVARIQEQEDKLGKARSMYEELYRDDSKNPVICHRLAIVCARMNDHQNADRYFREAIQLAPDRSNVLGDYGYALFRRNDMKGAERWLKQALTVEPANKRAANNLAIVLGHQGRAEESLAAFRRVVGEAEAQANLAYIHVQRGEGRMAVERYNRALAIDKNLHKASHALLQLAKLEQRYLQTEKAKRLIAESKARKTSKSADTVQLVGATEPASQPAAVIKQANYESAPANTKSETKQPTVKPAEFERAVIAPATPSKTPVSKMTAKPSKSAKSVAAPFPGAGSAKPVAPNVPPASTTQQVKDDRVASSERGAFKLTPQPQEKPDPAFATTSATAPVEASPKTATHSSATKPLVEHPKTGGKQIGRVETRSPGGDKIDNGSAVHRVVQASPQQPKFDQDPTPLENPFETLEQNADVSTTPARVEIHRGQNEVPARISVAPKAARIRLSPAGA